MTNIRSICHELSIKAQSEINEVKSRIPEDIAKIREWIKKQPHLTSRMDDQFLLAFLRGCKYSLEKTKSKIDHFYTIKSLSPEMFKYKQIDETAMRIAHLGPFLPLREPLGIDGPRIHITRYGHISKNEFEPKEFFKLKLRILDIQLFEDDNIFIGGLTNVVDLSSMTLSFILKFDFVLIKQMIIYAERAAPFRVKGIHFINIPKEALHAIKVIASLMSKKLSKRIMIHSSLESLYEHIPKKYLPKEYGGENGSFADAIKYWEQKFLQYKDFFEDDLNYGVNENLRSGAKVSLESLFGLEGSFRNLQVD